MNVPKDVLVSGWVGEMCMWKKVAHLSPLPKGTIEKLIGKEMTWEDEPICLDEFMYLNGDM